MAEADTGALWLHHGASYLRWICLFWALLDLSLHRLVIVFYKFIFHTRDLKTVLDRLD